MEDLINELNKLVHNLQIAAENERRFGIEICQLLETLANQNQKSANSLRNINETYGV